MSTTLQWRPPTGWKDTGIQGRLKGLGFLRDTDYLRGLMDGVEDEATKKKLREMIDAVEKYDEIEVIAR